MSTQILHYKNAREHSRYAKLLRKQSPMTERLLWNALSSSKTGIKFRRQHPLHPYIVDFACVPARLVVELDGASHDTRLSYDAKRDEELRSRGWTILRFSNDEIQTNLEGIVMTIITKAETLLALP